ncbi:hypothetical protein NKDENANG_03000 [Candidatus Entotheonellaceae bacterium PAL068K]
MKTTTGKWVQEVWVGLGANLGLRGIYVTPFPNFSDHAAEHYDVDLIAPMLRHFAANTAPFEVLIIGLGIFTAGLNPLLYVNVARSPRLSDLNAALWPEAAAVSAGIVEYYHPEQWVPHITLSHGDLTYAHLVDAMRVLNKWHFTWRLPIDNMALLYSAGNPTQDIVQYRLPLTGKS